MTENAQTRAFPFRPLYLQVKESLVQRLIEGSWQPGQLIPSEMELARELGVSQGTVRKALDAMTAENMLIRRQGRGTFVAEPEESRLLFQYFRLVPDTGERSFPKSTVMDKSLDKARPDEADLLKIASGDPVWRIKRLRTLYGKPVLVEEITLSAARFAGLENLNEIPNNVYRLYSEHWGITIGSASEKLKAISASTEDAQLLACKASTPLLRISRIAFDLAQEPVELRVSCCLTEHIHYASDLR